MVKAVPVRNEQVGMPFQVSTERLDDQVIFILILLCLQGADIDQRYGGFPFHADAKVNRKAPLKWCRKCDLWYYLPEVGNWKFETGNLNFGI